VFKNYQKNHFVSFTKVHFKSLKTEFKKSHLDSNQNFFVRENLRFDGQL